MGLLKLHLLRIDADGYLGMWRGGEGGQAAPTLIVLNYLLCLYSIRSRNLIHLCSSSDFNPCIYITSVERHRSESGKRSRFEKKNYSNIPILPTLMKPRHLIRIYIC